MITTKYYCDFCNEEVKPFRKDTEYYIPLFEIQVSPIKSGQQSPLIDLFKVNPYTGCSGQACEKCVEKLPKRYGITLVAFGHGDKA